MNDKLSFNKRIALTKKEVFDLVQSEDLDKGGNAKSGYHSIKTIITNLAPIMDKYDIDLDVIVSGKVISCIWVDCLSEATRVVPIELKPVDEIERLAAMQNIVQSEGAVLTYYRRYAITNCLNLNATDLIENAPSNQKNKPDRKKQSDPQPEPTKASDKQLKMLFEICKKKNISDSKLMANIKKTYGLEDKKDLNQEQFNAVIKFLNGLEDKA